MKDFLVKEIHKDKWMMDILKTVRDLDLPDCWIGAGFERNKAWDLLHEFEERSPLSDVDVVFLDKENISKEYEVSIHLKLQKKHPNVNWEVINQAKTHTWHKRDPYNSTEEAISEWIETATCIGVQLSASNKLEVIAPHGLKDLEQLVLRPVPSLKDLSIFNERIKKKRWTQKWPKLSISTP
jgi:hypothetical protein